MGINSHTKLKRLEITLWRDKYICLLLFYLLCSRNGFFVADLLKIGGAFDK